MIKSRKVLPRSVKTTYNNILQSIDNCPKQKCLLSSSFDKNEVELRYQERISKARSVTPDYCTDFIILPPPNITGKLHIGHALTITIEDVMKRFAQYTGKKVLWHPGFDHAGIATQIVVERNLWKEKKVLSSDLSKEEFLKYCEDWRDKRMKDIRYQIDKLAPLIDWDHSYYTMDSNFSHAVSTAFINLYNKGLIYRDKRIVNWCSSLQSVISDQEVKKVTVSCGDALVIPDLHGGSRSVRFGRLFRVKYKLEGSKKFVEIETSRPETIFADVAIAVNPNDNRYRHLLGKNVINPLVNGKKLEIVPSDKVKMDFGTGMLKLTPSHSQVDFDIVTTLVKKAKLKKNVFEVSCIDNKGRIVAPGTQFDKMDLFEAREKVINYLSSKNILKETTKKGYQTEIPICERSGNVVEGTIKDQWFMRTEDLHNDIKSLVEKGTIQINPEFHYTKLIEWLSNTDPWCLSRQISWGHQIPAYKVKGSDIWLVGHPDDSNIKNTVYELVRDTDVLDTWFSSSLAPIVTGGWPGVQKPRKLSFIETGHDILGFWVARMLTVCYGITGKIPFDNIYLHGLIRDSSGRKMSKSLGNVIDPLDVVDGTPIEDMLKRIRESSLNENEMKIAEKEIQTKYSCGIKGMGADALRYALLRHDVTSLDINVDILETAREGYHFCNKLCNMIYYVNKTLSTASHKGKYLNSTNVMDLWIKSRLKNCMMNVHEILIENFKPHIAFNHITSFILHDFCDLYLESTKITVNSKNMDSINMMASTMYVTLVTTFKILSIFMPQISYTLSESIVEAFGNKKAYFDNLDFGMHKVLYDYDKNLEARVSDMYSIVSTVKSIRNKFHIPKKEEKLICFLEVDRDIENFEVLKGVLYVAENLCNIQCAILGENDKNLSFSGTHLRFRVPNTEMSLYIQMPLMYLQKALDNYLLNKTSLLKKKDKYLQINQGTQNQLDNPAFKAKPTRRSDMEKRAKTALDKVKTIELELEKLEKDIADIRGKIARNSSC
uniref:valine--tRNA ligase n=1 Tax=Strongyloides venezuelensis TaxID=75913 RepID=A0A0K0FGT9_STRVS